MTSNFYNERTEQEIPAYQPTDKLEVPTDDIARKCSAINMLIRVYHMTVVIELNGTRYVVLHSHRYNDRYTCVLYQYFDGRYRAAYLLEPVSYRVI